MRNNIVKAVAFGIVAALPLSTLAQMSGADAEAAVQQALGDGQPASAIIQMLVEDGRSLEEAALVAVAASTGEVQSDLVRAGICAADDEDDAEDIGSAILGVVEQGGTAAAVVQDTLSSFDEGACDEFEGDEDDDIDDDDIESDDDDEYEPGGGTGPESVSPS